MTAVGRFRNTAKCFSFTEGAVDRTNIDEIAKAITSLNVWKKASKYNWALVSELFDKPLIAAVNPNPAGPIAARLMLFNGFVAHRDFLIFRQNPDLSLALSPMDFDHYEVIGLKDGSAEALLLLVVAIFYCMRRKGRPGCCQRGEKVEPRRGSLGAL